jgi:hypothetical protein
MDRNYTGTALSSSLRDELERAGWTPEKIATLPLDRPPAERSARTPPIHNQRQFVVTSTKTNKKITPLKIAKDGTLCAHGGCCRSTVARKR